MRCHLGHQNTIDTCIIIYCGIVVQSPTSESFGLSWRISPFITYISHKVFLLLCIWMETSALVDFLDDMFALIHIIILL